jgi:hypothetical protein
MMSGGLIRATWIYRRIDNDMTEVQRSYISAKWSARTPSVSGKRFMKKSSKYGADPRRIAVAGRLE